VKVSNPYRLSYGNYHSYLASIYSYITMFNSYYSRYIIIVIVILIILLYSHVYIYPTSIDINSTNSIYPSDISSSYNINDKSNCSSQYDHYIIYNINVKLQVNYEANHWFHMAENVMTYHSILRSKGRLGNNTSRIIYNFDTGKSKAMNTSLYTCISIYLYNHLTNYKSIYIV
jgi:hypothetical protein